MSYLENIKTFVRVYELGSMSAAGRDLRISPAVTSARISALEDHLNVRLFQRTTRSLSPTEQGRAFYEGALQVIEAVNEAEGQVAGITQNPRGSVFISAPLGIGRRLIAPLIPEFSETYPMIQIRLRLSDRKVDLTDEGLDAAFILGEPRDSALRMKKIAECERLLVASPAYVQEHGMPASGDDLVSGDHQCLNLRFPGATEFQWPLQTEDGVRSFAVTGQFECDDGDVLTDWALAGHGVALKPVFEIRKHLEAGELLPVATNTPPAPVKLACLYTHRKHQDPKTRLLLDFLIPRIAAQVVKA